MSNHISSSSRPPADQPIPAASRQRRVARRRARWVGQIAWCRRVRRARGGASPGCQTCQVFEALHAPESDDVFLFASMVLAAQHRLTIGLGLPRRGRRRRRDPRQRRRSVDLRQPVLERGGRPQLAREAVPLPADPGCRHLVGRLRGSRICGRQPRWSGSSSATRASPSRAMTPAQTGDGRSAEAVLTSCSKRWQQLVAEGAFSSSNEASGYAAPRALSGV